MNGIISRPKEKKTKSTFTRQFESHEEVDLRKRNECPNGEQSCDGTELCCDNNFCCDQGTTCCYGQGDAESTSDCCESDCICCPSTTSTSNCFSSTYYDSFNNVTVDTQCCPSGNGFACNADFPVCGKYFCWRYGLTECAFPINGPTLNQSVGCDSTQTCSNAGTCCTTATQTSCPNSNSNINGICCLTASQTCCNSACIDKSTKICCPISNAPSVVCSKASEVCCSGGCCAASSLTSSTGVNVLAIVLGICIPLCIIASVILAYFLWKRKKNVKIGEVGSSTNQNPNEFK